MKRNTTPSVKTKSQSGKWSTNKRPKQTQKESKTKQNTAKHAVVSHSKLLLSAFVRVQPEAGKK